jgi:cellulose synthase/poly-beta-1,6-N-acetylglucosamine synthase-like glycosyltransferase
MKERLKDTTGQLTDAIGELPSPKEALDKLPNPKFSMPFGKSEYPTTLSAEYASCCVLSYERPIVFSKSVQELMQTPGHPYELLIHDDGSTPQTARLAANMTERGATVILNKEGHNQGQGVALNRLFSMATGDPIIKLDADLDYHPGWLLEVIRLLEENPSIGLLGLVHYYYDPVDTRKTCIERHDEWSEHTHILGSAFAVRRECWNELGPFSEHSDAFAEDWEFQVKVAQSKKWKVALPKESLIENNNMGLGKSVVVEMDGSVHKINKEPYIIGKDA